VKVTVSACEPHRAFIEAQVRAAPQATAIYQDLVDQFGFDSAFNSVKRFARWLCAREPEQFDHWSSPPAKKPRSTTARVCRQGCPARTDTASRGCS
jgi:hypothetical protein